MQMHYTFSKFLLKVETHYLANIYKSPFDSFWNTKKKYKIGAPTLHTVQICRIFWISLIVLPWLGNTYMKMTLDGSVINLRKMFSEWEKWCIEVLALIGAHRLVGRSPSPHTPQLPSLAERTGERINRSSQTQLRRVLVATYYASPLTNCKTK